MTRRAVHRSTETSGAFLLDVNVLVALVWPNHVHHAAARRWFARLAGRTWATTPVTEFGFVRVSSNPVAVGDALSPAEALTVLEEIRRRPGHETWADDVTPTDRRWVDPARLVGHRQISDAHLLALARRHQGRLATLDQGLVELAGGDSDRRVTLIPFH